MVRRALGATSASALIFSIILISNLAVYYSSQGREASYAQSNSADYLFAEGVALEGTAATNLLIEVQSFLATHLLACSGAIDATAAKIHGLSEEERAGTIDSHATATLALEGSQADNLSVLSPFDGYSDGSLGMAVRFRLTGGGEAGDVSYVRTETHFVNLPVRLEGAAADCLGAVGMIKTSLEGSSVINCTVSSLSPLVATAARGPELVATRDGFLLAVSYWVFGVRPCTVGFSVHLAQGDIAGFAGPFRVELEGEGRASLGQ